MADQQPTDLPPPWFSRISEGASSTVLAAHFDGRHPDGSMHDHPGPVDAVLSDPSVAAWVRFVAPGGHVRVLEVKIDGRTPYGQLTGTVELCYLVVGEPTASPPAVQLIAFSGAAPDGTVLGREEARRLGLRTQDQVAAVRWFPGSGVVHQVYVSPEWRRRKVASKLLTVAELLSVAHGWQPLHGSGERTELGEELVTRASGYWRSRVVAQTTVMPPMTPGEA
ncbi:MAG: hypothetical protein QOI82_1670 [Actinomycetota bacterium]|jgi:GNAT superfamily N-acetyltransferase|nr:hypothetical protein [Actinomycetota bacterium]